VENVMEKEISRYIQVVYSTLFMFAARLNINWRTWKKKEMLCSCIMRNWDLGAEKQ
jgi:hypothetical protein